MSENNVEKISAEDLLLLHDMKAKTVISVTTAEKAYAQSRAAESEAKYVILSLFCKYGLRPGIDNIMDDGKIIKGEEKQTKQKEEEI